MSTRSTFFPTRQAFDAWVRKLPLRELLQPDIPAERRMHPLPMTASLRPRPQDDPSSDALPFVELSYIDGYPEFLIVRVDGPFRVIVRTSPDHTPYFRWFYGGETVYATYLFVDRSISQSGLIEGSTLKAAKDALTSHLNHQRHGQGKKIIGRSARRRVTRGKS